MKIIFPLGAFYPSQIGGPSNTLYWHTCGLKRNNLRPTIITSSIGIKPGDVEVNKMVEKNCGNVYYGGGTPFRLLTARKVVQEVKGSDIVHLNSLFSFLSIITFFYLTVFKRKMKIVWSTRGELNTKALQYNIYKKKPLLFIYRKMTNNVLFHSTSDQETRDICFHFPQARVVQIPNLMQPAERLLHIPKKNQLLFVGRIHPIKGLTKLIEGLSKSTVFRSSGYKLLIVGKHEERHKSYYDDLHKLIVQEKLEHMIVFAGHLEGLEKEIKYAESKFLILPSETENFGNVVVEALNQGTPVIASKGTPWDILEKFQCGFHINNSPADIAGTINSVLQMTPEKYEELNKNTIKLVDEKYNVNTQIHKWIKTYKYMLDAEK